MSVKLELRSDTFSIPCSEMRKAIAEAEVGDDVFGEDPTINSLERRVADLMGKEDGLFVPSGTMSNGLAIRTLSHPGERILCGSKSHIYNYEGDQFSMNCGLQMHRVDEQVNGMIPMADIEKVLGSGPNIHCAPVTILALENTHNLLGGRIVPQNDLVEACNYAHSKGVHTFLDGARLWHVHAETGTPLHELADPFDMISVCFSKALGAPVGSMVLGSKELIEKARWFRKRMGGAMRQVGILGAACHWALDNNLPQLKTTHINARKLAQAFQVTGLFKVDLEAVDSNILFLQTDNNGADELVSRLKAIGLSVLSLDSSSIRIVTHLSLNQQSIEEAVKQIKKEI